MSDLVIRKTGLIRFDQAISAIEKARSIDEVKDIRDKAEAAKTYAAQAGMSLEGQNMLAEIKLRAERKAGQLLQDMDRQKPGGDRRSKFHNGTMNGPKLEDLGISNKQSHRWQREASVPEKIFEQHVARTKKAKKELTSAGVLRLAKTTRKPKPAPPMPKGKYDVIYADPPWQYDFSISDSREIENQYETLSVDKICEMPVSGICHKDSVLFLWATSPKLPEALRVMAAWGFTYKTCMVWVKDKIGMGYYARQRHELLLIGTRGSPPVPAPKDRPDSVIKAPRGCHSEKPTCLYKIIEKMYPSAARVELFGRKQQANWSSWGDELP